MTGLVANCAAAGPRLLVSERDEFIGRFAELDELERLWNTRSRLITVLGPGGSGKSRLALHFAHRVAPTVEGGLWFCDLSSASTALQCIQVVARALDVPLPQHAEPSFLNATLGYALAESGRSLIVLDNLEQLIEPARKLLEAWLDVSPELTVLVTSRVRLRVPGEYCIELGPLGLPEPGAAPATVLDSESVRLLLTRARSNRRDFSSEPVSSVLAELVTKLEGLPLAIELCAARATALGPAQLLERLERRFETLIDRGKRSPRQATLYATIEWSWQLLASTEAQALGQCVVFRGDFDLHAAKQVLITDPHRAPLEVLESLLDQSLLVARETPSGERRYALFESVREFCDEKLEPDQRSAAEQRHAEYYLALAANLTRAPNQLVLEVQNLVAVFERSLAARIPERALRAALALEPVLTTRGPLPSLIAMLDAGIDAAIRAESNARLIARARLVRGMAKVKAADYSGAVPDLESSSRDADPATIVRAAAHLGVARAWLRRFPEAEAVLLEAKRRVDELGDPYLAGHVALATGYYHATRGDSAQALEQQRQALTMFQQSGARRDEAHALVSIGNQYLEHGALPEAKAHFTAGIEVFRELGERRLEAMSLGYLGLVFTEQGDFDEAERVLELSSALSDRIGHRQWRGSVAGFRGDVELERGCPERAQHHYLFATERLHECASRRYAAIFRASLAGTEAMLGRQTRARELLESSRSELREIGTADDARMLELWDAVLDALSAQHLPAQGAYDAAVAARARAVARRESVLEALRTAATSPPTEVRFVLRLLDRSIAELPAARQLRVAHDASWFQHSGARVSLRRRASLRLILLELVRARDSSEPARSVIQLFDAGWPGQQADFNSASHRVHVAVSSLRKLGLGDALVTRGEGYALDPDLPVERLAADSIRSDSKP